MPGGRWTFSAKREGSVLFPGSARAEAIIREFPRKKLILLEARTARNPAHHDLYWAILDKVIEATKRYPNSDVLNDALKLDLGITKQWEDLRGNVRIDPASIAWSAMPQEQFKEYFDQAMLLIGEHFYGEMGHGDIDDLEEMIGGEMAKRAAHGGRVPNDER